jgi:hypothetical protein
MKLWRLYIWQQHGEYIRQSGRWVLREMRGRSGPCLPPTVVGAASGILSDIELDGDGCGHGNLPRLANGPHISTEEVAYARQTR